MKKGLILFVFSIFVLLFVIGGVNAGYNDNFAIGHSCSWHFQCNSGYCDSNGYCALNDISVDYTSGLKGKCTTSEDCYSPYICDGSQCLLDQGSICYEHDECLSGLCYGNKCRNLGKSYGGEACEKDTDCMFNGWFTGGLECPYNHCVVADGLIDDCKESYQCNVNSICVSGDCVNNDIWWNQQEGKEGDSCSFMGNVVPSEEPLPIYAQCEEDLMCLSIPGMLLGVCSSGTFGSPCNVKKDCFGGDVIPGYFDISHPYICKGGTCTIGCILDSGCPGEAHNCVVLEQGDDPICLAVSCDFNYKNTGLLLGCDQKGGFRSCDTDVHSCVGWEDAYCESQSDCITPFVCEKNKCEYIDSTLGEKCGWFAPDCSADLTCDGFFSGKCVGKEGFVGCSNTLDCDKGLVCNKASKTCVDPNDKLPQADMDEQCCSSASVSNNQCVELGIGQCMEGLVCAGTSFFGVGACKVPTGSGCLKNSDCASGGSSSTLLNCINNICANPNEGYYSYNKESSSINVNPIAFQNVNIAIDEGKSVTYPGDKSGGAECTYDEECVSNICMNNKAYQNMILSGKFTGIDLINKGIYPKICEYPTYCNSQDDCEKGWVCDPLSDVCKNPEYAIISEPEGLGFWGTIGSWFGFGGDKDIQDYAPKKTSPLDGAPKSNCNPACSSPYEECVSVSDNRNSICIPAENIMDSGDPCQYDENCIGNLVCDGYSKSGKICVDKGDIHVDPITGLTVQHNTYNSGTLSIPITCFDRTDTVYAKAVVKSDKNLPVQDIGVQIRAWNDTTLLFFGTPLNNTFGDTSALKVIAKTDASGATYFNMTLNKIVNSEINLEFVVNYSGGQYIGNEIFVNHPIKIGNCDQVVDNICVNTQECVNTFGVGWSCASDGKCYYVGDPIVIECWEGMDECPEGAVCLGGPSCEEGEVCVGYTCLPDELCNIAHPCSEGFVCGDDSKCKVPCDSNEDCVKGMVCDGSVCVDKEDPGNNDDDIACEDIEGAERCDSNEDCFYINEGTLFKDGPLDFTEKSDSLTCCLPWGTASLNPISYPKDDGVAECMKSTYNPLTGGVNYIKKGTCVDIDGNGIGEMDNWLCEGESVDVTDSTKCTPLPSSECKIFTGDIQKLSFYGWMGLFLAVIGIGGFYINRKRK